ncbi:MAG: ABC transporter permease [Halobacteriales archaeon]
MGRLRIARRELGTLGREKTIVLAILIQLFIAAFSSFLVVGLVSMYDPGSVSNDGITVGVSGNASADLIAAAGDEGEWRLIEFEDREAAMTAFEQGNVDSVLHTRAQPAGNVTVDATIPDETLRSTVLVVQIREILTVYERTKRTEFTNRLQNPPLSVPSAPDVSPTFEFVYTVLLPLLMFLPAFISGSVAADAITEEYDQGTLDLLRVTPLSLTQIVDGKMLAMTLLVPLQTGAWILLLGMNNIPVNNGLALLTLTTAAGAIVVILGSGLALAFRSRRQVQFLYSIGVLVLFGGSYLLPESPANTVAKLAIGSPGRLTFGMVAAVVITAVAGYLVVRLGIRRLTVA